MRYDTRQEVESIGVAGAKWSLEEGAYRCRMLSSFWLDCEIADTAFTPHALTQGYWEAWITAWMSQQFDNHDTFVDIGANVGYYSLMAATHGMQTYAFEPNPVLASMIADSADANRLPIDRLYIEKAALSDHTGEIKLNVPTLHSGAAWIGEPDPNVEAEQLDVIVRELDSFNISGRSLLIKIDAEGAEPAIWRGMQKTLDRKKNCVITLEWQSERGGMSEFADVLYKKYDVMWINYDGREEGIEKDSLLNSNELRMLVLREKN